MFQQRDTKHTRSSFNSFIFHFFSTKVIVRKCLAQGELVSWTYPNTNLASASPYHISGPVMVHQYSHFKT